MGNDGQRPNKHWKLTFKSRNASVGLAFHGRPVSAGFQKTMPIIDGDVFLLIVIVFCTQCFKFSLPLVLKTTIAEVLCCDRSFMLFGV